MGNDTYLATDPTHKGPTLATAARLRELVRLIGPRWDVLRLLDAVLYDWEPRLAALVPPIPAVAVQTPSQPVKPGLVFGDEPYEFRRKGKRR